MFDIEKAQEKRDAQETVNKNLGGAINDDFSEILAHLETAVREFNSVIEKVKHTHVADASTKLYQATINMRDAAITMIRGVSSHQTAINMVKDGVK